MVIKQIQIKNFKGIPALNTELRRVNAILGPNGVGKTSVIEAVRYAATGKAPTDALRTGTSMGYVIADIEKVGYVMRGWDSKGSKFAVNGKTTTAKSIAESINEIHGVSGATANVMTSSELFAGLNPGEISAFLMDEGFLKVSANIDEVLKHCALTPEAEAELRMYFPPAPEIISINDIKAAHTYYYDARKAINKEVEETKTKSTYNGIKPSRSSKEIIELQNKLSKQYGEAKSSIETYSKLLKSYEQHQKNASFLKEKIDAITVDNPSPEDIEANIENINKLSADISDAERVLGVLKNNASQLESLLVKLKEPTCPISDKLRCTTDKTVVSNDVLKSIEGAKSEIVITEKKLVVLKEQKTVCEDKKSTLEKNALLYKQKVDYIAQLEEADKNAPSKPIEPKIDDIEILTTQIEALNDEYKAALKYEESSKAALKLVELVQNQKIYNELVTQLNPKNGIIQKIIEASIEPIEEYCNARAEKVLPKRKVKFEVSDGVRIGITNEKGQYISYEAASKGEKLRIRFIILDLLNALSGCRLLLIDDLDSLDTESLNSLLELVGDPETQKLYDHIVLCGIPHTETESAINKFLAKCGDSQYIKL